MPTASIQRISKDSIEAMCRAAGMAPALRRQVGDYDVLISDGFSLPPHRAFNRFGIDGESVPEPVYITVWWLMKGEDWLYTGTARPFEVHHNPEYDSSAKKTLRINRVMDDARQFVEKLKQARRDGAGARYH